jgi:hypothetical protein
MDFKEWLKLAEAGPVSSSDYTNRGDYAAKVGSKYEMPDEPRDKGWTAEGLPSAEERFGVRKNMKKKCKK